jgi:chemotaxis protein methyltransferase WspC
MSAALVEFESLLKQAMGLDAASIGASAIERAVQERVAACRLEDAARYLELVRGSAAELQALIETVVVPETWFFRDREAFEMVARMAWDEALRRSDQTLRVLSLPCSTGEEPYSIAMALLDGGLAPQRFRVDALDISARALEQARQGVYRKNSFRGGDLEFRARYFEAAHEGYRLREAVRAQVHFLQGNLVADDLLQGAPPYDFVFCRNLLIYFDRATQDRAVAALRRLLAAHGTLFIGPSETGLLLDHGFVSAKVPLAFAFRRGELAPRPPAPAPSAPGRAAPRRTPAPRASVPARVAPAPAAPGKAEATLDEASRLADQGHMAEAAKCCEAHLRQHGPSAEAFHLLGLIRAATGNLQEADRFYRKALYLDREHRDTLAHLALLLEKQGDATAAQVMRERLARVQGRSER